VGALVDAIENEVSAIYKEPKSREYREKTNSIMMKLDVSFYLTYFYIEKNNRFVRVKSPAYEWRDLSKHALDRRFPFIKSSEAWNELC